jgi:hypothetical protein
MPKKAKTFPLFLFLLAVPLFAPLYAHDADIEITGENRYKSVRLTPKVYNGAHYALSDLLIKNPDSGNVPYFINSSVGKTNETRETYLMRQINSYKENDNFFIDYKLAFERNGDVIATSIEFSTRNIGFAKKVGVFGSYDNIHWEFVQDDMLYVVDSKSKLNIDFKAPQKYTHYRLKLENNLEQISFYAVSLVYSLRTSEETYFIESFAPEFTVETKDKKTTILIDGIKNLRLYDLQIETDSMFIRNVGVSMGVGKELYNLSINGTAYTDTILPLNRQVSESDKFSVIINDADDRPINITGIIVRYYADDLVFEGGVGVYKLEFGADMSVEAPVYDIERYKNEILKGQIDRLVLGEITYVPAAPEAVGIQRDLNFQKLFFNIVVSAISILLGVLILIKLKK